MTAENDNPYVGMTPEETIKLFETRTSHPGENSYEIRPRTEGKGVTVVKIKPGGEEVHVDVLGASVGGGNGK